MPVVLKQQHLQAECQPPRTRNCAATALGHAAATTTDDQPLLLRGGLVPLRLLRCLVPEVGLAVGVVRHRPALWQVGIRRLCVGQKLSVGECVCLGVGQAYRVDYPAMNMQPDQSMYTHEQNHKLWCCSFHSTTLVTPTSTDKTATTHLVVLLLAGFVLFVRPLLPPQCRPS